ncbi:MAG: polyprenyl synthetase family protein, partial [Planctomycetota bacterium]
MTPSDAKLAQLLAPVAAQMQTMQATLGEQLGDSSPAVSDLTGHVSRFRGKQLRAALVLLSASASGNKHFELPTVAAIVEMIHLATLVHDDVLDGASVRRRVASVNRRWDNQVAVLLGDFLYARAFGLSTTLESRLCSRLLSDTTRILCAGEIESSTRRYDFEMSQAAYEKICGAKTASLYAAACELGARYPDGDPRRYEALRAYGWSIGLAFQIVDDCLDVMGTEETVGKSVGNDVEDGKVTLPVLHLYAQGDEKRRASLRDVYTLPELAGKRAAA